MRSFGVGGIFPLQIPGGARQGGWVPACTQALVRIYIVVRRGRYSSTAHACPLRPVRTLHLVLPPTGTTVAYGIFLGRRWLPFSGSTIGETFDAAFPFLLALSAVSIRVTAIRGLHLHDKNFYLRREQENKN